MFRLVLSEGRSLIRQRNVIEARAVELLSEHRDYQLLTSIPGIGPRNRALRILAVTAITIIRQLPCPMMRILAMELNMPPQSTNTRNMVAVMKGNAATSSLRVLGTIGRPPLRLLSATLLCRRNFLTSTVKAGS